MAKAATAPAPEFDLEAMHAHAGDAAQLLKALANERRLQVLCLLAAGERSVGEMQGLLDLGQSALSQHLAVLREAEIVACHEDGNLRCYYVLRPGLVRDLLQLLGRDYPCEPRDATQVRRAAGTRRNQCATQTTVTKERKPRT